VGKRVVTYMKGEWAINSFAPYKSPGVDGIFPALIQKARELVIPHLVRIFRACLATGYVSGIWRQVNVVYIPKPGRNSYNRPRVYRPISLTSFLLKTLARLVDRYLRDEALVLVLFHSNQYAYQAQKLVKTALYQLVVRVEKALDQQKTALEVFLDIEGAFNNTSYDTMCDALMVVNIPSYGGLEPPWRVAWLLRPLVDHPLESRFPGAARRKVCCHHFCGVW
jgi:hypothetical protein